MRPLSFLLIILLSALSLPAAEPTPFFDGKTLAGFTICNGYAPYRVINSEIVGATAEGSPNSFLCTEASYGDFVLEYETKTDPRLNSGVQVRAHRYKRETQVVIENKGKKKNTQPPGRVYGYQVETATAASGSSGSIYDEARRGWVDHRQGVEPCHSAFKDNQWNRYRIEAQADRIRTFVNGAPCADLIDPLDLDGFIGLQVHAFRGDSPAEVRWRNLTITDNGRHSWHPLARNARAANTTIRLRYKLPTGKASLKWGTATIDLEPTPAGSTFALTVSAHDGRLVIHNNSDKIRDEMTDLAAYQGRVTTQGPVQIIALEILKKVQ